MKDYACDLDFLKAFYDQRLRDFELVNELFPQDLVKGDGPGQPSEDEERCARLADNSGFDGELFRKPSRVDEHKALLRMLAKQLEVLPRLIEALSLQAVVINEVELSMLVFLAECGVARTRKDIAKAVDDRDLKTIRPKLNRLQNLGLIQKHGTRGGDAITLKGLELVEVKKKLPPNSHLIPDNGR